MSQTPSSTVKKDTKVSKKTNKEEQRIEEEFKKLMEIINEGYDPVPF